MAARAGFFPGVLVEQVFSVRFVSFLSEGVFPFLILIHEVYSTEKLCFASRQLSYFLLEHQAYFLWPGVTIIFLMRIWGLFVFFKPNCYPFLVRLSPRVVFSLVGPGRDQLRSAFFMECFFQFYGSLASSLVLSPQFPSWFVRS